MGFATYPEIGLWLLDNLGEYDVVLHVLDARDFMGTKSPYLEKYLKTKKPHNHPIFILDKVDLVKFI